MAPNKQKGKKKKEVTISWQEFMKDSVSDAPVVSSWADEMDDQNPNEEPEIIVHVNRAALPQAPRAVREADIDDSKFPNQPPFQAFIGNLPFDVSEDDIKRFFKNLSVVNVRLQTDSAGRLRGFGYVEFETRQMLIDSMAFNDLKIKNRSIRVDLASQNQGESDHHEKRDDFKKRNDGEDRTLNDWRKKDDTMTSDRSFRKDDRGGEFGSKTGFGQRGSNRSGYTDRKDDESFDRNRGFGGRQQKFGDGFRGRDGYQNRERFDRIEGNRENRGFDRRRDHENRDFERQSDTRENGWRQGARSDGNWRDGPRQSMADSRRDDDQKSEGKWRSVEASGPKERPKLNLVPRSKPVEDTQQSSVTSSIFGGAKPVDTSQREREIEEKLKKLRSSDDERKAGQATDDNSPRWRKRDSEQHKNDGHSAQRSNKENNECEQQSTATSQPAAPKVFPASAPKENIWEIRKNRQNQQAITTKNIPREDERLETEDSDHSVPIRNNSVSSITDEIDVKNESTNEDVIKTNAQVSLATTDVSSEPSKSNVWKSKTNSRKGGK